VRDVGVIAGIFHGPRLGAIAFSETAEHERHDDLPTLGQRDIRALADQSAKQQPRRRKRRRGGASAGGEAGA
jgi:hypothetical protein